MSGLGTGALCAPARYEDLDLQNLIEEESTTWASLYRSVRSAATIIEHLLKLEHSPAQGPRSLWQDTIAVQRADLEMT